MTVSPALHRRLGLRDATMIGVGSMLGAGVFVAFTPAAAAAGSGLLLALVLAGAVAWANARAMAFLAAASPTSGGAYAFGRRWIGPGTAFLAGWGFVVGKTASAAAMAMTVAAAVLPASWQRPGAMLIVTALTLVTIQGITRTAALTRLLAGTVLLGLGGVLLALWLSGNADATRITASAPAGGAYGIAQAAGLLFFAFAGYARITTLGEEVHDPRRTIPRAITAALTLTLVIYTGVALTLLAVLGPEGIAAAPVPLHAATTVSGLPRAGLVISVIAALAALGALLALLAGIGRTVFAMARERDLPLALAAVHPRTRVPYRAEIAVALAVCAILSVADVREMIGFSSFGVLLYYVVANLAALRASARGPRRIRGIAVLGALACTALIVTLPPVSVVSGVALLTVGVLGRGLLRRTTRSRHP